MITIVEFNVLNIFCRLRRGFSLSFPFWQSYLVKIVETVEVMVTLSRIFLIPYFCGSDFLKAALHFSDVHSYFRLYFRKTHYFMKCYHLSLLSLYKFWFILLRLFTVSLSFHYFHHLFLTFAQVQLPGLKHFFYL